MTSAQDGENASTPDPMHHHGYITEKDKYLKRLKRIEGQARGISRMIEEERYCIDILTQTDALTKALQGVALALLDDHLRHCVRDAAAVDLRALVAGAAAAREAEAKLTAEPRPDWYIEPAARRGLRDDATFQANDTSRVRARIAEALGASRADRDGSLAVAASASCNCARAISR
mgnify:CR=1 FL=1